MNRILCRSLTFTFTFAASLAGQSLAQDKSAPPPIVNVSQAMEKFVASKEVAGVVTLIADAKGILHKHATGMADIEQQKPIAEDSIFWIASMSKPVTGVCVMILVDEGKLKLEDPVSQYIPEMSNLKLEDGTAATITLRHLLTHTSGMAELPGPEAYASRTLAEAAEKYSKVKVLFTPGSKWQYSQTSINTAARIVEIVSGKSFDAFLDERICKPLGMRDTGFYLNDLQMKRLAKSYRRTDGGDLVENAIGLLNGKQATDRNRFPAANGGLFSTASDYAKFCRMLLAGGTLDGAKILSEEAVKSFRSPSIDPSIKTGFTPGNTWGVGCCVVQEPTGITAMLSPGSFGHGGAYGTQAWIDPVKGRCYILMVQRSNFPNSDASEVRRVFQEQAARGLD
jgi:CubicO group peptidase (beta-lactamase class C family)